MICRFLPWPALIAALTLSAWSENTPLSAPLSEEKEITITCEVTKSEPVQNIVVFSKQQDADAVKGTYHYKLWLPKGYLADTKKRWPCVFISSPSGNAGFGAMGPRLKSGGYIVVLMMEAKNGPWEPIVGNFVAAHDDVVQRARIQEGLKFATGFSGGARMSGLYAQCRPGFAGLILQSAGFPYASPDHFYAQNLSKMPGLLVAMIMGDKDQNHHEVEPLRKVIEPMGKFYPLAFAGGHQWSSAELFNKALDWIEASLWTDAPAQPALHDIYLEHFQKSVTDLVATTDPWMRYQGAAMLGEFARSHNLITDPAIAATARNLESEMIRLRNIPAVAREALAADAFQRLKVADRNASSIKLSADLNDLAKRYPGTQAAKKALETP